MNLNDYTDNVIDHFMSPRNLGSMVDADGIGTSGDPDCGDYLHIYIKVNEDDISEVSFLVFGCAAAVASSSMTTELTKGKSLDNAYKITSEEITVALGGLPEYKLHCSVLGAAAVKHAIDDYRTRHLAASAAEQ